MILGLCGKKQSGKSTVARYLKSKYKFQEISWAEPLKEIIGRQIFGITESHLTSTAKEIVMEKWGLSPRQILQIVGTDCFRNQIHPDIWVILGVEKIQRLIDIGENVVVSDCRFPNEVEAIRKLDGIVIEIEKLGQISEDTHISENSLKGLVVDEMFQAEAGDLKTLYEQADKLVKRLENVAIR